MAIAATGALMPLNYIEETTVGTTPTTGTVKKINCSAETFEASKPRNVSADISENRKKKALVSGLRRLTGGFNAELGEGYEDFFRSLLRRRAYTTDTFSDTVSVATAPGDITAEITFSGAVSISGMIAEGPIKLSGFTDTDLNDTFYVVSASGTTGKAVIGRLNSEQDLSGISEAGTAATITQTYIEGAGRNPVSFTVEKVNTQIGADNGVIRLAGEQVASCSFGFAPGDAPSLGFDFMGESKSLANDSLLGPHDWVADGITAAAATSIAIKSGTTDPAAGDIVYFADDSTKTGYTVSSYAAGQLVISPALAEATTDEGKLYFSRPATDPGNDQKMENNLGRVVIDGTVFCLTAADMTISNNLAQVDCIGSVDADQLIAGDETITGTISANYSDTVQSSLVDKVIASTSFSMSLFASDVEGNVFCLQFPRLEGDEELIKKADNMALIQNIPVKALEDETTGASCYIHVLSA